MDKKINVLSIDDTWDICPFKFRVFVDNRIENNTFASMEKFRYILETLKKWFGDAEYFWGDNGHMTFLCGRK